MMSLAARMFRGYCERWRRAARHSLDGWAAVFMARAGFYASRLASGIITRYE